MSGTYASLPTALLDPLFMGALNRSTSYRSPLEGRAPNAAPAVGASAATPAVPTLGDSSRQPAKSVMSPEQTLGAMARSAAFGLGFAANPVATGLGSFLGLALSDALGQKPSFSPRGAISNAVTNPLNTAPLVTDKPASALDISSPGSTFGEFGYGDLGDKTSGSMDIGMNDASPGATKGGESAKGAESAPDPESPNSFAAGGPVGGALVELAGGGKVAMGPGGGLDDLIPTSIQGRQAARLSDGEFVIPADVVSMMGDGSTRAGSQRLYDLVKGVRSEKTGTPAQAGPLPVGDILRRIFG